MSNSERNKIATSTSDRTTGASTISSITDLLAQNTEGGDILRNLFKELSSVLGKGIVIANEAVILFSGQTREEFLTAQVFEFISDNEKGAFILGREFEQFRFTEDVSKAGIENIIEYLNTIYADFDSRLTEIEKQVYNEIQKQNSE